MRKITCAKLNEELEALDSPPYPGEFGQKIYDSISKKAWDEWMQHQTKIINELKLSVFEKSAQDTLQKHAEAFFFGTPIELNISEEVK